MGRKHLWGKAEGEAYCHFIKQEEAKHRIWASAILEPSLPILLEQPSHLPVALSYLVYALEPTRSSLDYLNRVCPSQYFRGSDAAISTS